MKISELKMLGKTPNSDPDRPGRPHLIGVYRKDHDRVYVWQRSIAGYDYEIEYTGTGKKVSSQDSFKNIDQDLRQQGYRSIIEDRKNGSN